jgi:serine/threonine-protein kinase RsbW
VRRSRTFPSRLAALHALERFLVPIRRAAGLSDRAMHEILIAATEAFTNAVNHGGGEGSVDVAWSVARGGKVRISVRDRGAGFDADAVADPRLPENLLLQHGRGVFIMRALAERVEFRRLKTGMRVTLFFAPHPPA